jgi:hypothetical protein
MMCLYCPTCGVRTPCVASEKQIVAVDVMDYEWAEELELYCEENSTDHIECSVCHAR